MWKTHPISCQYSLINYPTNSQVEECEVDANETALIGNGFCNDITNVRSCDFDGGDCCGSCINSEYCTECICLGGIIGNGIPNARVGDAFCNDETNNVECNYDDGDCCGPCLNKEFCSDCLCHLGNLC